MRKLTVAGLGLGLALLTTAAAQTPPGSAVTARPSLTAANRLLTGVVVTGSGLPIPGARVKSGAAEAETGPDGRFQLDAAAMGPQITAFAPGFEPAAIRLQPDQPLRIALRPAALTETVTVAATERAQPTAAVPTATAVMGAARLHTSAPVNVDSILREFSDLGTFRTNSSLTAHPTTQGVSLLGTGSSGASRALVLLDRFPLNDFYGGWVDWLRVPVEDLNSVSVVSGGASALYGSEALSGVIALETRAPTTTHLELRAGGGSLGTALIDGAGAIAGPHWQFGLSSRGVHVGGYVPSATVGAVDNRAGVSAQNWAPTVRYIVSPTIMLSASGEYFGEDRRNGTPLQVNATRLRQITARALVEHDGLWDASYFNQSEDFDSNFSSIADDRNSEKLVLEQHVPSRAQGAGLHWTLARPRWSLVAGTSYTHITAVDNETTPANWLEALRRENGRQRLMGGFVEASFSPAPGWSIIGTLRKDHWDNYDAFNMTPTGPVAFPRRGSSAWSPSLGTVWALRPWLSLRLSGYESFRAPTLNELYRPFRAGNVETLANPLLAAERYRGAQAGAVITPRPGTHVRFTYFDGYVSNLVTSVTLASTPGLITRQRQNLGRVRPRGETVAGDWRLPVPASWPNLSLWTSYTHVDSIVLDAPSPDLIGHLVPHVPANNFSARLLARAHDWTFSAVERFGGSNFDDDQNQLLLPAFWNTDLYVSRSFGRYEPYVAAENLWNRRYAIQLSPTPVLNSPRAVTAGIRVRLGD